MRRGIFGAIAGFALLLPGGAGAAELAGTWKLMFYNRGLPQPTFWLLRLEDQDGKWSGRILASAEGLPATTLANLTVSGDRLRFLLKAREFGPGLAFEAFLPAEGARKVMGSLSLGQRLEPAVMEPTKAETFGELNREILARAEPGPEILEPAMDLLRNAGERKAKAEEVRSWADKAFKAAAPFGPRFQQDVAVRVSDALASQENLGPVGLEYAHKAERLLDPKDEPMTQMRVLEALAAALRKASKTQEAKEVEERISKIDLVTPTPFPGRKTKSDRAVLVELFTGAQCPPCVAADLAFDALAKTYKPAEVVLLQYHLHIPGPDPLTNPDTEARQKYYADLIEGTPTILFNGKTGAEGGGSIAEAQSKYSEYLRVIGPLLDKPVGVKLQASARRKGDTIDIKAEASELENPSDKMRLRLALTEEVVHYKGGNRLASHHHVVRALPGGAAGKALPEATGKQSATVDLAKLRKEWAEYLDTKRLPPDRPLEMKNLRVVAFVQNDATQEILQAIQVDVGTQETDQ